MSAQNEAALVRAESMRHERKLLRALRKVDRTGEVGREASESLWLAGFIQFGPPREGVSPWNCYRLTAEGRAAIARAEGREE